MSIHFDVWTALAFVLQFVLPLVVGLVTTKLTPGKDQFLLLAGLTAVVTLVTGALAAHDRNVPFDFVQGSLNAAAGFLVSVGSHFGIWRPSGATAALLAIGSRPAAVAAPAASVAPDPAPAPTTPSPAAPAALDAPLADVVPLPLPAAPAAAPAAPALDPSVGAVMGKDPGANVAA
jgi:hypothetical protein